MGGVQRALSEIPVFPMLAVASFREPMKGGSTRPWVVGCENSRGEDCGEYVIKFRKERGGTVSLAFEVVAARLAAHFEVPIPPSAFLEITPNVIVDGVPHHSRFAENVGLNFGSRFLSQGFQIWPTRAPVLDDLIDTAARIVAFDAVIDNADRTKVKPNLLYRRPDLYVIDHEMAFAFCRGLLSPHGPTTPENLDFLRNHPLSEAFGGGLDVAYFGSLLDHLDDERIKRIVEVPEFPADEQMSSIASRLRMLRDSRSKFLSALSLATR